MVQYRRLSAVVVGIWLGASILADVAVTQNFQTVDRFLAEPGGLPAAAELHQVERDMARSILRYNAGEENYFIFQNWERAELALGIGLLCLMMFAERPDRIPIGLAATMTIIVAGQHFFLTDSIAELGRLVDTLPRNDPGTAQFWMLHGLYSGLEILKLVLAVCLIGAMTIRLGPVPRRRASDLALESQPRG